VTGLAWRHEVAAQVFEEAAVDLSRALTSCLKPKAASQKGRSTGFPRSKRKGRCRDSFRLRNKYGTGPASGIRIGEGHPRCVTLPTIGMIRVHNDTRALRRLLRPAAQINTQTGQPFTAPRAKVLFATVSRHGSRWYVQLNIQAPDFHANRRHRPGSHDDSVGFVGVDRGLSPPPRMEPKLFTSPRLSHSPSGSAGSGAAHEPYRAPSHSPGIEPRPSVASLESTPGSPTFDETSFMKRPATSPRPTADWLSKIWRSPTLSATDTSLARSVTPRGQSSVDSSATRQSG